MKKSLILTTVVVLALGLRAETNAVFKCEVKVLDAAAQPVVGAVVERFPVNPFLTPTEPLPAVGRDTTDRNGAVLLTSTNQAFYSVVASKPGLGITWGGWYPGQMPDQEDAVVELAFTAPKTVAGIVQDAAGKPGTTPPLATRAREAH